MRYLARFGRNERGQALVEFALVLPILLILVLGIIEFGRAWNLHQTITHAAREGARTAAMFDASVTETQVEAEVKNSIAASGFNPDDADITFDGFKAGRGLTVTVRIEMPFRFGLLAPFVSLASADGTGTVNLATYARMRNE